METVVSFDSLGAGGKDFNRPAFTHLFTIAGRFVSVESSEEQLSRLCAEYFAAWHVNRVDDPHSIQPHVKIVISASGKRPQPPRGLEPFNVTEGGLCWADSNSYFFEDHGSVVSAPGVSPPQIRVWLDPVEPPEGARLARLIFNAAMAATRRCGLYQLHGAGLIAPGERGVLIIGPSGAGKSTLATQLTLAGWQYLSDDSVWLSESNHRIVAHALRRAFALHENSFAAEGFEDLNLVAKKVEAYDPAKRRFEPRTVFPQTFAETCLPSFLFFSSVSDQTLTETRELSTSETMAQLLRMCPWACYDKPIAADHLRVLAQLARQSKGFELTVGSDLFCDYQRASRYLLTQMSL